jgi:hypothetical protein
MKDADRPRCWTSVDPNRHTSKHTRPNGMPEAQERERVLKRVAWLIAVAVGMCWLAGSLTLAALWRGIGIGAIVTSLVAAFLAARVMALVTTRVLLTMWEPVQVHVSLRDPAGFRRRLDRHYFWWRYRVLAESRGYVTYGLRGREHPVLATVVVLWEGSGARITGPRGLVRAALRRSV